MTTTYYLKCIHQTLSINYNIFDNFKAFNTNNKKNS